MSRTTEPLSVENRPVARKTSSTRKKFANESRSLKMTITSAAVGVAQSAHTIPSLKEVVTTAATIAWSTSEKKLERRAVALVQIVVKISLQVLLLASVPPSYSGTTERRRAVRHLMEWAASAEILELVLWGPLLPKASREQGLLTEAEADAVPGNVALDLDLAPVTGTVTATVTATVIEGADQGLDHNLDPGLRHSAPLVWEQRH